jgi:hypothetical protein
VFIVIIKSLICCIINCTYKKEIEVSNIKSNIYYILIYKLEYLLKLLDLCMKTLISILSVNNIKKNLYLNV